MSENNFEQQRENIKRKDLLNRASLIEVNYGVDANRYNNIDLLCRTMVDAAKTGPVKAEYEDKMFAIDKDATKEDALQAWKEHAGKPFMEQFSPDIIAKDLKLNADNTDLGDTVRSYWSAAGTEILVTKYPEYADKVSMLQLLNAFNKSSRKNIDAIAHALIQNAKRFTKGEETFPPTLENMVALDKNKDMLDFALGVGVNSQEFERHLQETELKMLKNLKPENLSHLPDSIIYAGAKIAEKHKDSGDFKGIFSQEVMNRLSQGKIFNPNIK